MTAITAKAVIRAAAAVRDARSRGIETPATRAAPHVLRSAEAKLWRLVLVMEDEGVAQSARALRAEREFCALSAATAELRAALRDSITHV